MATVKYYTSMPSDMIVMGQEGTLLDHDDTSAEFKTRFGGDTKLYSGHDFTYDGNTLVGGTVTEISYKTSGGDYYRVSGLNWDMSLGQPVMFDGDDLLIGSRTSNYLYGEAGNDWIRAGKGDDSIRGGEGDDMLKGGRGADHFIFFSGDGQDTILDFEASGPQRDILHFRDAANVSELTFHQLGRNLIIEHGDDSITLRGVDFTDLSRHNFEFG